MSKKNDGKVRAVDKNGRKVWVPAAWLDVKKFGFRVPPSQRKAKRNKPTTHTTALVVTDSATDSKEDS
ncbi:hypothetical protein ACFP47_09230 [Nesterenkonia lacusekhoensis]|uniref:hypothetical protein n=1 Tax=Nesterenkonia lacusekhoensis TaxID=150832 RepID=UPI0036075333